MTAQRQLRLRVPTAQNDDVKHVLILPRHDDPGVIHRDPGAPILRAVTAPREVVLARQRAVLEDVDAVERVREDEVARARCAVELDCAEPREERLAGHQARDPSPVGACGEVALWDGCGGVGYVSESA